MKSGQGNINATVQQMHKGIFDPDVYGTVLPTMGNAQPENIKGDIPIVHGSGMPGDTTISDSGICSKCLVIAALAIVIGGYLVHYFSFQGSAEI